MVQDISVKEMKIIYEKNNKCQIIDVREIPEFEYVRIPGSRLIPLSEFEQKMNLIESDCSSYFLCGIGKRALKAAEFLESLGYKDLYVISGGIKAWLEAGFPVESSATKQ